MEVLKRGATKTRGRKAAKERRHETVEAQRRGEAKKQKRELERSRGERGWRRLCASTLKNIAARVWRHEGAEVQRQ